MNSSAIDLIKGEFWIPFGLALVLLVPLARAAPRQWAAAIINLTFLFILLKWNGLAVAGAAALLWLGLRLAGRGGRKTWLVLLGGGALLGLFLLHKRPDLSAALGMGAVPPVLAVIGFSYVALRLVEVARAVLEGRHPAPDFAGTVNYLLPFHMLAAGPIQSYDEFRAQPGVPPALGVRGALEGVERIAFGMFKKYVLAYAIQKVFLTDFRAGGWYFFLEAQLFFVWVYLDFSAYSDIAVGVGRLLGLPAPENFNRPYLARNINDFWERWHISLSQWLRRNLFIPLQLWSMRRTGARFPLACASLAFTISFLFCGLWHQLSLLFLSWGALHALGLVAANLYKQFLLKRLGRKGLKAYLEKRWIRVLATLATYEYVAFSLVFIAYPWKEVFA